MHSGELLIKTKLFIPPLRSSQVARPRLTARLNETWGAGHKLTLLSAPAGFGKTTLVTEWCLAPQTDIERATRAAWLSLEPADNDPTRFFTYLIAALQNIQPDGGPFAEALTLLHSSQPPSLELIVTLIVNQFSAGAPRTALVLDDYHTITAAPIHHALTFLCEHLPAELHLVMSTRQDPPLPLTQMRGRGELIELRAADLRFTPDEAAAFLNQRLGFSLSPAQVTALEARTEGWIAGLQLAAISLQALPTPSSTQGQNDIASFIRAFTGTQRFVLEYLVEQALEQQPESVQSFLLQTSILERMNAVLCNAVGERADSQMLLEQLERTNLFLVPLDEQRVWYRYHQLFADVLRHRLQQTTSAENVRALHHRASEWFAQHDSIGEAIPHALASNDNEYAATLIQENADVFLRRVPHDTLQKWIEQLPPELIRSRPRLALARAWAFLLKHQLDAAEANIVDAETAFAAQNDAPLSDELRGEALALRAEIAFDREQFPRGIELAEQALARLPQDRVRLRAELLLRLGAMYSWVSQGENAQRVFRQAESLSLRANDLPTALFALFNQGGLAFWRGQLKHAAATHHHALELADTRGLSLLPILGYTHADLGELHYYLNELDTAEAHLREALMRAEQTRQPRVQALALPYLARIQHGRGDLEGALAQMEQTEQIARERQLPARYTAAIAALHARMWLAVGDLGAAVNWMNSSGFSTNDAPAFLLTPIHLTLIRVAAARGQTQDALAFLTRVKEMSERGGWLIHLIELSLLKVMIVAGTGERERALEILERGCILAAPIGVVRMFLNEGEPMRGLLTEFFKSLQTQTNPDARVVTFVERTLDAFPPTAAKAETQPISKPFKLAHSPETLSEREIQVLRLIAEGFSNQELAQKLYLSVGTVKVHLKHIYSKLDVNSRTQAVARARELQLL